MDIGDKVSVVGLCGDRIGTIVNIRDNYYEVEFADTESREKFIECEISPYME